MSSHSNDPFYRGGHYPGQLDMGSDGLTLQFNLTTKLLSHGSGGGEVAQSLPPYGQRPAFLVDDWPVARELGFMTSDGMMLSYIVPVLPEHGAWIDFNGLFCHSHDVAVIVSVQGVNAITGRKTDQPGLEQYRKRCPIHDIELSGNRRCSSCGFEWPAQNYLATTGTSRGLLWIDGWRQPGGEVRQFYFTEDQAKSVAKAVLGDDRTFSLGAQFYLSREKKPRRPVPVARCASFDSYLGGGYATKGGGSLESLSYGTRGLRARGIGARAPSEPKLEIGAGAKIRQRISPDPKDLSYWQDDPALTVVINYAPVSVVEQIVAGGRSEVSTEGFLGRVDVPKGVHD